MYTHKGREWAIKENEELSDTIKFPPHDIMILPTTCTTANVNQQLSMCERECTHHLQYIESSAVIHEPHAGPLHEPGQATLRTPQVCVCAGGPEAKLRYCHRVTQSIRAVGYNWMAGRLQRQNVLFHCDILRSTCKHVIHEPWQYNVMGFSIMKSCWVVCGANRTLCHLAFSSDVLGCDALFAQPILQLFSADSLHATW